MKLSPGKKFFYLFMGIFTVGILLRVYELSGKSFKICDEGYHLMYPFVYSLGLENVFYFKHGLMMWIYWGLSLFSFTVEGALLFNVFCGILTMPLFYLLCRQFLKTRASLFAFLAFASSYYIIYYHRTFLSDGFGLFFFTATLLLIIITFRLFGIIKCPGGLRCFKRYRYLFLLFAGVLLGFSYTVRIQTCLALLGVMGACGAAFVIYRWILRKRRVPFSFGRYVLISGCLVLIGILFYYIFLFHIVKDAVLWESTLEWYGKNFVIASGQNSREWQPFLMIFLFKFCSLSFLAGGFAGLLIDAFRVRSLNIVRLAFLISAAGLGVMYFYLKMPWPRAYLYFVCFLCIYWGIFLDAVLSFKILSSRKWLVPGIAGLTVLALFIGEFRLLKHMFTMDSNYNKALAWIGKNSGKSKFSTTHAWPIIFIAAPRQVHIIYDKAYPSYEFFLNSIAGNCRYKDIRFVVVDSYASYFRDNHDFLERLYREFEPTVEFSNDYGLDEHTSYDAFGVGPCKDIFIDKIVIFDVSNMKKRPEPLVMEKK